MGGQRLPALPLGLLDSPDFAAGIAGKKLVEPVLYACEIVVHAVGVDGVQVVVDGNIPHSMLGKGEVDIQSGQGRIAAQSGQVFRDAHAHAPRLHFGKHGLKAGAVVVGAGVTVIHKKYRVREAVVFSVLEQDSLLIANGKTLPFVGVLLRKAAVKCRDFVSCP